MHSKQHTKRLTARRAAIIFLSFLGLVLSLYLLKEHLVPTGSTFCDINSKISCDIVNKSPYALLFGVPVSLLGVLYWAFFFLFSLLRARLAGRFGERRYRVTLRSAAVLGLLFSAYLSLIEAFVLRVWCPLCVVSALAVIVITILAFTPQETI